jgi:hypothetical protein
VIFKWALILFGTLAIGLLVLSKLLAILHPPRPGRPPSRALRQVERALRWSVLIPAALAVLLLILAMLPRP